MSIGNVGQLTMDLITSSLSPNCYHIGYLHDPCILPVVGNDALVESSSSSGKLNVSAEGLFICSSIFYWYLSRLIPVLVNKKVNHLKEAVKYNCEVPYVSDCCELKALHIG